MHSSRNHAAHQELRSSRTQRQRLCDFYIDDVCIFASTIEAHIEVLHKVLKALHDLGVRVVYSNCMFTERQVPFLGFLILQARVKTDPQRIPVIKNYTVQQTKSEVRSFFRLITLPQVKKTTKMAQPMTLFMKIDAIIHWVPECKDAMDTLKERLTKPPILAKFN